MANVLRLSQNMDGTGLLWEPSAAAIARLLYSASVEDLVNTVCFLVQYSFLEKYML